MSLVVERVESLAEIDAAEWQPLVPEGDPFVEHGFLGLLEQSQCVGDLRSGWLPMHLVAREGTTLVGALPLYLKHNSYGEFIFDFGWADGALRAGISYYPKLVSAVPFTPVGGRRLLTHPDHPRESTVKALIGAARDLTLTTKASSLHVLFCDEEEAALLAGMGLHARQSTQYHFVNQSGFSSFDAFAKSLRSSVRKNVRRERTRAQSYGLRLSMRPYGDLDAQDRAAMGSFYLRTIDNFGSHTYLTPGFFAGLAQSPHAHAAMAHDGSRPVAGALFFWKDRCLFGRYWGSHDDLPMLHFELCYYLPMAWGFERGMRRFEAGAQGEHKIRRGLLPCTCHSAHWAVHPGLDRAIGEFVRHEARYVEHEQALLGTTSPYHREG